MEIAEFAKGVFLNLLILPAFVILCGAARSWTEREGRAVPAWQMGVLYGFTAVIAMLFPYVTPLGMIFDCRSGVIGMIALIGGPTAALASLPLPLSYRLNFGGYGTLPGLLEMILPAVLGSIFNLRLRRRRKKIDFVHVALCSLMVAIVSNGLILALVLIYMPESGAELGVAGVGLVIINTALSMSLLSSLVLLEQAHFNAMRTVAESERRMRHSQKMAAIGQLSSKVAHSFLNALTAILGNAREARDKVAGNPEATKYIDRIIAAAEKISPMTGQLLAFAHPGPLSLRLMEAAQCVTGIREILSRTIGPEIEVVIRSNPKAGTVNMDPDQMEQAIVHLAVNAADAMNGHGRLDISVDRADLSRTDLTRLEAGTHLHEGHKGPFAVITVADTGCGIPDETSARIFEPFFTTKHSRKNTGLGLATVYKIVELHDGYVDFQSRPGKGTVFLIYLPIVDDDA